MPLNAKRRQMLKRIYESQVFLRELNERYPGLIDFDSPKPFKVGIREDLINAGYDAKDIKQAFGWYCSTHRYISALEEGTVRVGLDGEAGSVSAEDAQSAEEHRKTKWHY